MSVYTQYKFLIVPFVLWFCIQSFKVIWDLVKIKQFNFHSLRHTFATNCISLGVDYKTVSELLGHANVNITLNLYVHPRLSQKKKCIDMICKVFQESI